MNKDLTERISICEARVKSMQSLINQKVETINQRVDNYGQLQEKILFSVRDEYRNILHMFENKLKEKEFDIPTNFESNIKVFVNNFSAPEYSKFQNVAPLINGGIMLFHKGLENFAAIKGKQINAYKPKNGIWWIDLACLVGDYICKRAQQKEAEETAVVNYEKEVNVALANASEQLLFLGSIVIRIDELRLNLVRLHTRFYNQLRALSDLLPDFNPDDDAHIQKFNILTSLVKCISDYSFTKILDEKNKLSDFDRDLIIRSKKLLA